MKVIIPNFYSFLISELLEQGYTHEATLDLLKYPINGFFGKPIQKEVKFVTHK